jgi:hypothetical protein
MSAPVKPETPVFKEIIFGYRLFITLTARQLRRQITFKYYGKQYLTCFWKNYFLHVSETIFGFHQFRLPIVVFYEENIIQERGEMELN